MSKKIGLILLIIVLTNGTLFGSDLSLKLKNDYFNILSLNTNFEDASLYTNNTLLSLKYKDNDFTVRLTGKIDKSSINIINIDRMRFDPISLDNNEVESNELTIIPELYLQIFNSWINFDFNESLDFSFDFQIPISSYLNLGFNKNNVNPFFNELKLFNNYNYISNNKLETWGFYYNSIYKKLSHGLIYNLNTISTPDLRTEKDSMFINLNSTSDYDFETFLGWDFNIFNLTAKGGAKNVILDNPLYLFHEESAVISVYEGSELIIQNFGFDIDKENFSLSMHHKNIYTDSIKLKITSEPLLYGPFIFRKYLADIGNLSFYITGIDSNYKLKTSYGDFNFGIGYKRIYSENIKVKYTYGDYLWTGLSPDEKYTSGLLYYNFPYNHLNLINITINHVVSLKNIEISTQISQLIPFFDLDLDSSKSSDGISNQDYKVESIFGGFKFSIALTYYL